VAPVQFREQPVQDFLSVTEIRGLQAVKGLSKVQEILSGCALKDAERAGNIQAILDCDMGSPAFVNQQEIRVNRKGECNRSSFAWAKRSEPIIRVLGRSFDFRPRRECLSPYSNRRGS
jgi:hypothetical protein